MSIVSQSPEAVTESLQPTKLLWADCEFTGLDITEGHRIIEIGVLVTDLALRELDEYQSFVKYDWGTVEGLMDKNPWWDNRAADRARMKAGTAQGKTPTEVDHDLASLVEAHFATEKPPVCGNSVRNDMTHIDAQFKDFAERLHYRVIDVSSIKLIANKYLGIQYEDKLHQHYALPDIRESVDEFRFLLTRLGIVDFTQLSETK